jgi:hypothetical protein
VVTGAPKRTRVAVRSGVEASTVSRRERKAGYMCVSSMHSYTGRSTNMLTTIVPLTPLSNLPGVCLFFSPGLLFLTFGVSPVGGRHAVTYPICATASGASRFRSDGTGSATMALNEKAYMDKITAG